MAYDDAETALRELLASAMAGDASAYHSFLKRLAAHLRAFFRRRLIRLPGEVEDLVQETLLAVHNQRHTYDPGQPITAWIHAIAKYKLIDCLRRRSRRELVTDSIDDDGESLAAVDDQADEARRDVATLLQLLPDRQRLPILHVKLQGLSVIESAQLTGLSVSAVKIGIHRGLKVLAAKIRSDK